MLDFIIRYPITLLIASDITISSALCPKREEKRFALWGGRLLAVALVLLVNVADYFLVDASNASTTFQAPMCLLVTFFYLAVIRRLPVLQAVYCMVWAHLLTDAVGQIYFPLRHYLPRMHNFAVNQMVSVFSMIVLLVLLYVFVRFLLSKELMSQGAYLVSKRKILLVAVIAALFLVMTNYQVIFWLLGYEPALRSTMIEVFRLVVCLLCIAVLFLQNNLEKGQQAKRDLDILQQMWHRQQEQFKMSKENIDLINRKCHDLKHQMAALRTLRDRVEIDRQMAEMEAVVMIYDSVIHTGNSVLDVVLTEKSLYCEAHNINMTCMVDGSKLDFVDRVDLYTLFGNALDNAIESVMKLMDKEKRVIQVSVFPEHGMLMIRIRNYCQEKVELVDGLPKTSKDNKDYHGFGLKSIRYTAEKYGGGITVQALENSFCLQILLPIPEETSE